LEEDERRVRVEELMWKKELERKRAKREERDVFIRQEIVKASLDDDEE
jgi:hypothetical protein